jgi:4,5-DOPA dioxygenase extradiol
LRRLITSGDHQALVDYGKLGRSAALSIPTDEHYLPLLYAAGAVEAGERPRFFNEGFQAASISMRSVVWG